MWINYEDLIIVGTGLPRWPRMKIIFQSKYKLMESPGLNDGVIILFFVDFFIYYPPPFLGR